ncbi:MAG: MSMEG_0570 family nitrogen starvation response protein [Pacificibacter sp.]|uniref:MSMEG_0570 family nitrogen starvation response protein n=1 Tax=Pacificibacter sp. TaxID=1917866 RepID=UPI00321A319F
MPEARFTIQWPDGQTEDCYSPSTVIRDFLAAGTTYTLSDFLSQSRLALEEASTRVEAKFGYRCTSADAQLEKIENAARAFSAADNVTCLSIT